MKIKVNKIRYEKVNEETELDIPETPMYFWHNGIRRAYSVVPEWTAWNVENYQKPEEIWKVNVVMVDPQDRIIETNEIQVHTFPDILKDSSHRYNRLITNLLFNPDEDRRTKEQFIADYNQVLEEIAKNL